MSKPAFALAACALSFALGGAICAPQAFADDASDTRNGIASAAEAVRGELGPALSTYDQARKTLEALETTDIAQARVQGSEKRPTVTLRVDSVKDGKKTEASLR